MTEEYRDELNLKESWRGVNDQNTKNESDWLFVEETSDDDYPALASLTSTANGNFFPQMNRNSP